MLGWKNLIADYNGQSSNFWNIQNISVGIIGYISVITVVIIFRIYLWISLDIYQLYIYLFMLRSYVKWNGRGELCPIGLRGTINYDDW